MLNTSHTGKVARALALEGEGFLRGVKNAEETGQHSEPRYSKRKPPCKAAMNVILPLDKLTIAWSFCGRRKQLDSIGVDDVD